MQESFNVYNALRENILHKEDEVTNETIYMYVTYFALISIGTIWNSWLSLISFIDLIVFQSIINRSQLSITKTSIYLRTFFETKDSDVHWETLHSYQAYRDVYTSINQNIGWYICKYGSTLLAIISFLAISIPALSDSSWNIYSLSSNSAIQIVAALIFCILTIYVNRLYFFMRDSDTQCSRLLTDVIQKFYQDINK